MSQWKWPNGMVATSDRPRMITGKGKYAFGLSSTKKGNFFVKRKGRRKGGKR